MKGGRWRCIVLAGVLWLAPALGGAQTNLAVPDSTVTTTLTAAVSEQADVSLPATVAFTVNDVGAVTSVTNINVTI